MTTLLRKKSPVATEKGVAHTFDRNGALVVNAKSLMANGSFQRQIYAAATLPKVSIVAIRKSRKK